MMPELETKQELATDEVESFVKESGRIFVKLPVTVGTNFVMNEITEFIRNLEAKADADIIVFCAQLLEHTRIPKHNKHAKWQVFDSFIHRMHLDILPYVEVIISVAKEDAAAMESVLEKHGINKSYLLTELH